VQIATSLAFSRPTSRSARAACAGVFLALLLAAPAGASRSGAARDAGPPTAPPALVVSARTTSSVTLFWEHSTDDVGVAGYLAFKNGRRLPAVMSPRAHSHTFVHLNCGRDYALSIAAVDAAGNVSEPGEVSSGTDCLVPASGALFGAFVRPAAGFSRNAIFEFEQALGRRLNFDNVYDTWEEPVPNTKDAWDLSKGRIPEISLGGGRGNHFPGLTEIANGDHDAWLRATARGFAALGSEVFFRPMYEMNGRWEDYNVHAASTPGTTDGYEKFVAAWRHMHDVFAQEGATNVVWVWSPSCSSSGSADAWEPYYPGDAYVDWVACDGYNWGTAKAWSHWSSFAHVFGGPRSVYREHRNKPFMVGETASCEAGGDKSRWIANMGDAIERRLPRIKAVLWFESQKECDWRAESSPASFATFKALFGSRFFNPFWS